MIPDSDLVTPQPFIELLARFLGLFGGVAVVGFVLIVLGVVGAVLLSRSYDVTVGTVKLAAGAAWVGLALVVVGGGAWLAIRSVAADLISGGAG